MKNIIIVESPSKTKTIEGYMGKDYKVLSSKGHVRDLAISGRGGLGIDVEDNFRPTYENIKEKEALIKELQRECKNACVFLATDPDREGEAISWHLAQILNLDLKQSNRVVFNEITKPAILEAFKHPRQIDMNLVSSQETRRILDRIIGFKLSKLLQSKIKSKSAGRVQSVALKMIVDLEKEIVKFKPEEYWTIKADFHKFTADLEKHNGKKIKLNNIDDVKEVLNNLGDKFIVGDVDSKTTSKESKPAYITSTLQQEASTKLNFDSSKTMRLAQGLYEGKKIGDEFVGLITYMRTDSDRLSDLFINDAKSVIENTFGKEYIGSKKHKKSVNSQDAHEAIRPTSPHRTPEMIKAHLTNDEYKLYNLIYNRAMASLMAPAKYQTTKVSILNNGYEFKANGSVMVFDGFTKFIKDSKDQLLPNLKIGDSLEAKEIIDAQHFTTPPSRYSEAQIIKDMEELGIGRPSTYAQTIKTLKDRDYISVVDKKFIPTEQGIITVDKLDEFFKDIINVKYTASLEEKLDKVASNSSLGIDVVKEFYNDFIPMLDNANANMKQVSHETGEICPICGKPLVKRKGRFGEFDACSGYPKCKYIKKEEVPKKEVVSTGVLCPICKKGHMVERIASKGKSKGKSFYACDNYPKCKNIVSLKPTGDYCEKCGSLMVFGENGIICSNENCNNK